MPHGTNNGEIATGAHPRVGISDLLCVGGRVRLLKSIYDDGEEHHPPAWLAMKGEILVVRKVHESGALAVSHENVTDRAFALYPGEYETHNEQI